MQFWRAIRYEKADSDQLEPDIFEVALNKELSKRTEMFN
jgi:hypothetical protein